MGKPGARESTKPRHPKVESKIPRASAKKRRSIKRAPEKGQPETVRKFTNARLDPEKITTAGEISGTKMKIRGGPKDTLRAMF